MTKIDIKIFKRQECRRKCHFCERTISDEFYDLDIDWEDNEGNYGRYRHICLDCHCALKKVFTGVD